MRMAFLAASPSSVTRPIWKYTSLVIPRIHTAASAPNVPKGSAIITDRGSDHFSYCAARMRKAMSAPSPRASTDVPPERFSWNEAPLQSSENSGGSTSLAMRSTSAIAWPELTPGAPLPKTFTDGRLLKRSSVPGPLAYSTRARAFTGIISPFSLLTYTLPTSSGRLRNAGSADMSTCQVRPYLLKSFT